MPSILVFGLGNPGAGYENTYHNTGFQALSLLKKQLENKHGHAAIKAGRTFAYWKYGDVILASAAIDSSLYMNQSGIPVQEALAYFKLSPERLVVLHDDSDLPLGAWKLTRDRGAAGHHGVESVIDTLGTQDFWRGRIGIRPPEPEGQRRKAEELVLKTISSEDEEALQKAFTELSATILNLQQT